MPLFFVVSIFTTLLSLSILGGSGYLLWTWWQGEWLTSPDGVLVRVRDDWRLWTGLGLAAWSLLGRVILTPLLAKPDKRVTAPQRGAARVLAGASGSVLHVETHGRADAPPIVFTHGWGLDSTIWRYAREDLSDRFKLVLWDLPGLGASKAPRDGRVCLPDFARDLEAVLAAAGSKPAVLVGHSIGGMTIQTLVRDNPAIQDRIAGLVLLNTTYTNPLKTMILSGLVQALRKPVLEPLMRLTAWLQPLAWLMAWQSYLSGSAHLANRLGFGRFVTRSQLEHVTLLATRNPPGVQAKGNLAMFDWDATGALARFDKPVLVIGGDKDIVTKLEASRVIARETATADLRVIEDVNHLGFLERADLYNGLIAEFVRSVQGRAPVGPRSFVAGEAGIAVVTVDGPAEPEPYRRPPGQPLH